MLFLISFLQCKSPDSFLSRYFFSPMRGEKERNMLFWGEDFRRVFMQRVCRNEKMKTDEKKRPKKRKTRRGRNIPAFQWSHGMSKRTIEKRWTAAPACACKRYNNQVLYRDRGRTSPLNYMQRRVCVMSRLLGDLPEPSFCFVLLRYSRPSVALHLACSLRPRSRWDTTMPTVACHADGVVLHIFKESTVV